MSLDVNFNESLTNDIVSFEQLGPGCKFSDWPYIAGNLCDSLWLDMVSIIINL